MALIAGKYKNTTNTRYDEYLQACGVGWVTRRTLTTARPTIEIVPQGDNGYKISDSGPPATEMNFQLDEKFDEKRADGTLLKTVISRNGNVLVQQQSGGKEESLIRWEFSESEMKLIYQRGDVEAVRTFERVKDN